MWFLDRIIYYLQYIGGRFRFAAYEMRVYTGMLIFVSYAFETIASIFYSLATYFAYFNAWVYYINSKIGQVPTFATIFSYLSYYLNRAIWAYTWTIGAYWSIRGWFNRWWAPISATVWGWIVIARSALQVQINSLIVRLVSLGEVWNVFIGWIPSISAILSWFSNWWANILAGIINWGALTAFQIQSLINSAFTSRELFWAGWQDWRDRVTEFITDPEQWFYDRLEEVFERYW